MLHHFQLVLSRAKSMPSASTHSLQTHANITDPYDECHRTNISHSGQQQRHERVSTHHRLQRFIGHVAYQMRTGNGTAVTDSVAFVSIIKRGAGWQLSCSGAEARMPSCKGHRPPAILPFVCLIKSGNQKTWPPHSQPPISERARLDTN